MVVVRKEVATYQNPKTWGDPVNRGDIFRVTEAEANENPEYIAGDFMIAKFTGSCDGNDYPDWGKNNDEWDHAWSGLSDFRILLETGSQSGSLYGNGQNQIGVVVSFTPIDANGTQVPLSEAVLAKTDLTLINFTTAQSLPSGWTYSRSSNEFHTLPEGQSAVAGFSDDVPPMTYYVSCATDEPSRSITIGSKITLPGGGYALNADQHFSAPAGNFKSSVSLRALEAIFYGVSNTQLDSQDIDHGSDWEQVNYYFTITEQGCYIFKATISGPTGPTPWSLISKNNRRNRHYIWQLGPEDAASISGISTPIRYNQRRNAVCLTRLTSNHSDKDDLKEIKFTVYDQYGNKGVFIPVRDESNGGNTLSVREVNPNSKG